MRIRIALWLPRTAESVTVARQALDRIFTAFGVRPDCRNELALAVSEACSNAVVHATGEPIYEVAAESVDSECVITVNDSGPGLGRSRAPDMPPADAESGRGMALMRISADRVQLHARRGGGLSVRMFKRLQWSDDALGRLAP